MRDLMCRGSGVSKSSAGMTGVGQDFVGRLCLAGVLSMKCGGSRGSGFTAHGLGVSHSGSWTKLSSDFNFDFWH